MTDSTVKLIPNPSRTYRPTVNQTLLLQAALLSGEEAEHAFERWQAGSDIDHLDVGSFRLLPLLYRNLSNLGVESPLIGKLKGIYRRTWVQNQILFRAAAGVLKNLQAAGIDTLILKGAAITQEYYHDFGLRPMDDFDFLVHRTSASQAIESLINLGWVPTRNLSPHLLNFTHSTGFTLTEGKGAVDLHWHILGQRLKWENENDFWSAALPTTILDVPTKTLCPTDHLLQTCLHGIHWDVVPSIRWVADAEVIIKHASAKIDWERLVEMARQRRLILPLYVALSLLAELLHAPIPEETLEELRNTPVSRTEEIDFKLSTRQPRLGIGRITRHYLRYNLSVSDKTPLLGFPRYLQFQWELDRLSALPAESFRKGIRKLQYLFNRQNP